MSNKGKARGRGYRHQIKRTIVAQQQQARSKKAYDRTAYDGNQAASEES